MMQYFSVWRLNRKRRPTVQRNGCARAALATQRVPPYHYVSWPHRRRLAKRAAVFGIH